VGTEDNRHKHVFRYDNQAIANAAGIPHRTVKEHRTSGRFNPDSLRSVAMYIASYMNRVMAEDRELDEWKD